MSTKLVVIEAHPPGFKTGPSPGAAAPMCVLVPISYAGRRCHHLGEGTRLACPAGVGPTAGSKGWQQAPSGRGPCCLSLNLSGG